MEVYVYFGGIKYTFYSMEELAKVLDDACSEKSRRRGGYDKDNIIEYEKDY